MKGEGTQMTDTAQRAALIEGINGLGCILNHQEMMFIRQCHDRIHVTSHTGIMDHDDHLRTRCDQRLDGFCRDIGMIHTTVCKHHLGTFP